MLGGSHKIFLRAITVDRDSIAVKIFFALGFFSFSDGRDSRSRLNLGAGTAGLYLRSGVRRFLCYRLG